MHHFQTLIFSLVSVIVVGVLHFLGAHYDLYYILPWYDIPAHLIAGVGVGFFAVWVHRLLWPDLSQRFFVSIAWTVSFVLFIAVVWEVFELYAGISYVGMVTPLGLTYNQDVTKDVCIGIFGGLIAYMLSRSSPKTKRR